MVTFTAWVEFYFAKISLSDLLLLPWRFCFIQRLAVIWELNLPLQEHNKINVCLTILTMQYQCHAFVVLVPKPHSQHFYTSCIEIGEPTDILSYTYNSSPE